MKNKRSTTVKLLLDHPKTDLKQASMKYGTVLHVCIANHDFSMALKLLKKLKALKDIDHKTEINKVDEEKNTSMHMLMRHFNVDPDSASKVAVALIKRGSNLKANNVHKLTPLHVALYYGQNEAI